MKSVFVDFPYRKQKIRAVERLKQKHIRTQQSLDLSNNQSDLEKKTLAAIQNLKTQSCKPYQSMTNALLIRQQKEYQRSKRFSFNIESYNNHEFIQQQQKQIRSKILPSLPIYNNQSVKQQQQQYRRNKNYKQPNKILDLMIDILKEQKPSNKHIKTVATPIQSQFSMDSFSGVRLPKKYKGPKVIQNEILKHSNNLNVVRKKLSSQHKEKRQITEPRIQLNSSSNNRFVAKRISKQIEVWNTNVELLTFYPKAKQKNTFQECISNEFLDDYDQ